METDDTELHAETDAARAGSTPNIVRWILVISLFAAIVLLSIIWITGAATQSDAEDEVSVTSRVHDPVADDAEGTDSIVDDRFEEIDEAPAADGTTQDTVRTIENEQAETE